MISPPFVLRSRKFSSDGKLLTSVVIPLLYVVPNITSIKGI